MNISERRPRFTPDILIAQMMLGLIISDLCAVLAAFGVMNLPPEMQSLNFSRGSAIAVAATCAFLAGSWLSSIPLSETLVFRYGIFWMVASIALTTVLLNEVGQNGLYWLLVGAIPFTGWLSVRYFTQSRQLQLKSSFAIAIVCIHALFAGLMFFGFPLL